MARGPRLTNAQIRRIYRAIGRQMSSFSCSALDAACGLYEDAQTRNDTRESLLLTRFFIKLGLLDAFKDALERRKQRREQAERERAQAQQQNQPAPAPPADTTTDAERKQFAEKLAQGAQAQQQSDPRCGVLFRSALQQIELDASKPAGEGDAGPVASVVQVHAVPAPAPAQAPESGTLESGTASSSCCTPVVEQELALLPQPETIDDSGLTQSSARLRDALCARTMTRTVRELEAGRVDMSRLAQIGAGLTLRPYQDTTLGRSVDTACYLLIDVSSSMFGEPKEGSRLEPVCAAALAIVKACKTIRVQLAIGAFHGPVHTIWRGGSTASAAYVLGRLRPVGGTNTANAVEHATQELVRMRAKRHVLIGLCDGFLQVLEPAWRNATKAGIDWRVVGISPNGKPDCMPQEEPIFASQLWKERLHMEKSGQGAARAMLDELRKMLEDGTRRTAVAV